MNNFNLLPDILIKESGRMSKKFLDLGIDRFLDAILYVKNLNYGYNSTKDDAIIIFSEGRGTCTTKHACIAELANELGISIFKNIGIYKFDEDIVSGSQEILDKYNIPYIPMIHCFLTYNEEIFDLTAGNKNGKNKTIENFIFIKKVAYNITEKEEYLIYKEFIENSILNLNEFKLIDKMGLLKAREEALKLLKSKI